MRTGLEGTMVRVLAGYIGYDGRQVSGTWACDYMVVSVGDEKTATNPGDRPVLLLSPDGTTFKQPLRNIVPASTEHLYNTDI